MNDIRCPACQGAQIIGIEVRGVYDGVLYWRCDGCCLQFHRWPEGHYLRGKAEPFVDAVPTLDGDVT